VVDGLRRNGKDGKRGEHGKERNNEEDGALRQGPSDEAGEGGDADVAGVVEGGIAPHTSRQLLARDETERKGCDRWAKNVADHRDDSVGDQNWPEARPKCDDGCAGREHGEGGHDEAALGVSEIDQGADRRLHGKPEQTTNGRNEADLRLAPMLLRHEKDV
jgi:hypothetical protein